MSVPELFSVGYMVLIFFRGREENVRFQGLLYIITVSQLKQGFGISSLWNSSLGISSEIPPMLLWWSAFIDRHG